MPGYDFAGEAFSSDSHRWVEETSMSTSRDEPLPTRLLRYPTPSVRLARYAEHVPEVWFQLHPFHGDGHDFLRIAVTSMSERPLRLDHA